LVITCLFLGWLGANPVEFPYNVAGFIATLIYFGLLYVYVPYLNRLERKYQKRIPIEHLRYIFSNYYY